jgi:hypothetical protein
MDCFYCGSKLFNAGDVTCCSSCGKSWRNPDYIPPELDKPEEEQRDGREG